MYTLENCEKLWDEAGHHGTIEERMERTKRWESYYNLLAEKAMTVTVSEIICQSPFVTHLANEGILTPNTTVLDIGAGMGSHAFPFGKICREVTALEPVDACVKVLKHKSAQLGLNNIHTICDFWESFSPEKTYDVIFSSMCPAICNTKELYRMENMSNRTCCLVAVQRGSYDKHRKEMMMQLQIEPQGGMTTEAIHYINALYLMGRQPNVKFWESRHAARVPIGVLLEQYIIYFEIFGVSKEKSVPFLKDYFAKHAENGFLLEESYLRQALIYWNKE